MQSGAIASWNFTSEVGTSALISCYGASVFSDPNGGAAMWIHWRKSSVSKQLLGFMRAVIEVVQAEHQRGAPAPPLMARINMDAMLHGCIPLLVLLFNATNSAALWPALREWITDHGIKSVWAALARSIALAERERAAACVPNSQRILTSEQYDDLSYAPLRMTIACALSLATQLPRAASANRLDDNAYLPGLITSLSLLFGDILPRDLAAGNAHMWDLIAMLRHIDDLRLRSRCLCVWGGGCTFGGEGSDCMRGCYRGVGVTYEASTGQKVCLVCPCIYSRAMGGDTTSHAPAQGKGHWGRHTVYTPASATAHCLALPHGGPEAELQAASGGRCYVVLVCIILFERESFV